VVKGSDGVVRRSTCDRNHRCRIGKALINNAKTGTRSIWPTLGYLVVRRRADTHRNEKMI